MIGQAGSSRHSSCIKLPLRLPLRKRQAPGQCETPAEPAHLLVQHLELPAHKGVVVGVDVGGDEAAGRKKGGEKEEKTAAQA